MAETPLAANLQQIQHQINTAAAAAGRAPGDVRLIAVSKTVAAAQVAAARACGQTDFGENRVPDLLSKATALGAGYRWHFIGHLQKNKVRAVVKVAHLIHSVDSVELAQRLQSIAAQENCQSDFLVQVNISGEISKFGVAPEHAAAVVAAGGGHSRCRGLMTMAPLSASTDELHAFFAALRQLRDQLQRDLNLELPELSMGMSGDFAIAIAEGATMVRIGTALFQST